MLFRISKYDAVKAILQAEAANQKQLAYNILQIIRRATRKEIESSNYTKYYIINERDKKYLEGNRINCIETYSEEQKLQICAAFEKLIDVQKIGTILFGIIFKSNPNLK